MSKSILIINSSPRKNGTSASFSRLVGSLAQRKGAHVKEIRSIDYLSGHIKKDQLKKMIEESQIITIITPLYIDTMPYPLIYLLENMSKEFSSLLAKKCICVIAQSGFPSSKVMDPIINSISLYAKEHGMNFLGGVRYGGGVLIDGKDIGSLGKKGEKIIYNFDLMLNDILAEKIIVSSVVKNLEKDLPKFLYRPLAAFMNHSAMKNGRLKKVDPLKKVYIR